jgi:Zn-dependent membrane protease YugP
MLEHFEEIAEYYDLADFLPDFLGSLQFGSLLFLIVVPACVFVAWVNARFRKTFNTYAQVPALNGFTGVTAAQRLLDRAGIRGVRVVRTRGWFLTDHYNPLTKELALSEAVYHGGSVAAVGIAAHEVGHAIQHANNYFPLWLRSVLIPVTKVCCPLGGLITLYGVLASSSVIGGLAMSPWTWVGLAVFSGGFLFPLATLPVEFDASRRARRLVADAGILQPAEREGMHRVLRAAALTYVAQTLQAWFGFVLLVAFVYFQTAWSVDELYYDP